MSEPGGSDPPKRRPVFDPQFLEDLAYWKKTAPSVARRLLRLVDETLEAPFIGIGKPEPLRFDLQGHWSRRLTRHDRMVYQVTDETVGFLSARFHYD
ncbi:MAG: Txe/YoeB family addiction module toxin [Longimicrobiaceae bacterium]